MTGKVLSILRLNESSHSNGCFGPQRGPDVVVKVYIYIMQPCTWHAGWVNVNDRASAAAADTQHQHAGLDQVWPARQPVGFSPGRSWPAACWRCSSKLTPSVPFQYCSVLLLHWMRAGHAISDPTYAVDTISNAYIVLLFVSRPAERAIVNQHTSMQSVPSKCFHQQCIHCFPVVWRSAKHAIVNQHKCVPIHETQNPLAYVRGRRKALQ